MSRVMIISDLHFGHKGVERFRPRFKDEKEHSDFICDNWNDNIMKRDVVYVLGDAAFSEEGLARIASLPGMKKYLVRGNHDKLSTRQYMEVFDEIYGIICLKGVWLSHAPIHPDELWNRPNMHGHVHKNTIPDNRYYNACLENNEFKPFDFYPVRGKLLENMKCYL